MNFALIMDIAILALLAATVGVGFKLTMSLRNFRESRGDMEGVLNRLAGQIEHAERAVGGLQNAARTSGSQLQDVLNEAKFLADELRFMNEAGNNLAARLENLADRNRELVTKVENSGGQGAGQQILYNPPAPNMPDFDDDFDAFGEPEDESFAGFRIHDREHSHAADEPSLGSQAERELFEALSRHRSRKPAAGRA